MDAVREKPTRDTFAPIDYDGLRPPRKSYARIPTVLPMPKLIQVQIDSFNWFKEEGLRELFDEINPIQDFTGKIMEMRFLDYEFREPRYTEEECRERDATYAAPLHVTVQLLIKETGEIKETAIFLGDFPLMTENGTFVINGAERVVVSQLVRSPGVYFTATEDPASGRKLFSAKLIPNRGAWLEFETSNKDVLSVKVDRKRKIPVTILLRAIGYETDEQLEEAFKEFDTGTDHKFIRATIERDPTKTTRDAVIELYKRLRPGDPPTIDNATSLLQSLLFNPRRYDLAKVGRYKLNNRLGVDIPLDQRTITKEDLFQIVAHMIQLNNTQGRPDDIDHLGNRRIRAVGELIQNQFRVGLLRMERVIKERMTIQDIENVTAANLINIRPVVAAMREFFGGSQLSQFMDQTNPLAELTHKRRLSALGPGGLSRERAGFDVRDVHHSHYGRICPIETPEGPNIGLIGSLASYGKINQYGFIETPYRRVINTLDNPGAKRVTTAAPFDESTIIDLPLNTGVEKLVDYKTAEPVVDRNTGEIYPAGTSITEEIAGFIMEEAAESGKDGLRVLALQTPSEEVNTEIVDTNQKAFDDMVGHIVREPVIDPDTSEVIAAAGTEITMEIAQAIAAQPKILRVKIVPVVSDTIEYLSADVEDRHIIAQANSRLDANNHFVEDRVEVRDGPEFLVTPVEVVEYMDVSPKQVVSVAGALIPFLEHDDANRALMGCNMQRQAVPLLHPEAPIVGTGMEYQTAVDSGQVVVAKEDGIVSYVSGDRIRVTGDSGREREYSLIKFLRSNQDTCINQRTIVSKGQRVRAGQVMADSSSTENGELALGQNILVAFMPWEGGNFEDAILMSDRMVRDDYFTSIHIEKHEVEARDTKLGPEEITRDIPNVGDESLRNLDERGIIYVGAEVGPNDILVGKITPKGETELTAEERLLRAIFGEKAREVKDTSLRVPHGVRGKVIDVRVFSREQRELRLGDKEVIGRTSAQDVQFGGEIAIAKQSKILQETVDELVRAHGSRVLDTYVRTEGDDLPAGVNELVRVSIAQKRKLSEGDKMAGRHGNKGVISKILPMQDMPFLEDGTPVDIILNPIGVPSRMNIGQVLETHLGWAAKELGFKVATPVFDGASEQSIRDELARAGFPEDGKVRLYDGRTGEPFDDPVTVGYIYMLKLAHLVEDKIHARSTGPYSLVTQQPLGGKAQFGGQRFGEMEVWALEAYGAAYTLQEMLTVKSDDVVGRVKTYEAIVKGDPVMEAGVPESFKVLVKELQSLGLSIEVLSEDEQPVLFAEDTSGDTISELDIDLTRPELGD